MSELSARTVGYLDAERAVSAALDEASAADEPVPAILHALGETVGWGEFAAFWAPAGNGSLHCQAVWTSPASGSELRELVDRTGELVLEPGVGLPGRAYALGHPTSVSIDDALASPRVYVRANVLAAHGLQGGLAFPVAVGRGVVGVIEVHGRTLAADDELLAISRALATPIGHFLARKRAESEARRLKDEFISLMSHELRTPLSSVLGYLELIEREECGPLTGEQRDCLAAIGRNANRLLGLVGDLMLVARLEAGDVSLEPAWVPLAELGAEAVEQTRADADAKGIELRLDRRAEPVVSADPMRLAQVLSNLLSNAVKFTPAGGGATLVVAADGGQALLEVADTGMGISADERPQIYEPFFRTESARAHAVQGPGLGLAITKALVEAHGGTISCRSEEGTGSTFRVELPLPELDGRNGLGSHGVD